MEEVVFEGENFYMQFMRTRILSLFMSLILLFLLANISCAQKVKMPENWKKFDLPLFSFFAPSDFVSEPFKGKDSAIWKYKNQDLELTIDLGLYSAKPVEDKNEDNYVEKSAVIDKKKATIVSFKFSNSESKEFNYITAVYFPKIDSGETKLSLIAHSKTPEKQEIAEKIFRSIKFKSQKK